MIYVIDPETAVIKRILETYQQLEWSRPLRSAGRIRIEINRNLEGADLIQIGDLLGPIDKFIAPEIDGVYVVEQIENRIGSSGKEEEVLNITGRSYGGMFEERVVIPPSEESHDSVSSVAGETALKHYVNRHAGDEADVVRQLPNFLVADDLERGDTVSFDSRYQMLNEVLEQISIDSDIGWGIEYDQAENEFIFDVIIGDDLSESVFFDVLFDTVLAQRWLVSELERKTFAIVAGQGEGEERAIEDVFIGAVEPSGLERKEMFIDARDVSTSGGLVTRGRARLRETESPDVFEVELNKFGSFRYRRDFFIGDIVLIKNDNWNVSKPVRIVNVITSLESGRNTSMLDVQLERAFPTMKSQFKSLVPEDGSGRS